MDNFDNIEELKRGIQEWITQMQGAGKEVNLNDINNHLAQVTQAHNTKPRANFNGFTAQQMTQMIHFPLDAGCPVQLRRLTDEQIVQIPIMRQVLYLMNALAKKEIKLTVRGYLPPKMVEELYNQGSKMWGEKILQRITEDNFTEIKMIRSVLLEEGLVKIRTGKLSLTVRGKKILKDQNELLRIFMVFLFREFHTGWADPIEDYEVGNVGRLYSLWLLHHFGQDWRNYKFYAQEYFKAFPSLRKETGNKYFTYDELYATRTFNHFFGLIGLCEIKNPEETRENPDSYLKKEIRKTPILDMMFSFEEPAKV